jgi:hypothetical protein
MLRGATAPQIRLPQPDPGPSCDPWSIVRAVTRDLARAGVKTRFGADTDLTAACGHAAQLLDALGVAPVVPADDDDPGLSGAFPAWRAEPARPAAAGRPNPTGRPRLDGSLPAGDERVNRARILLAERHEPLTMTPGDLRGLLARQQRVVAGLLEVIDGGGETHEPW